MRRGAAAVALAAAAALAGCAADDGEAESPALPSADVSTDLTVTVSDGEAEQTFTVQCDPAGGTHPRPESACQFLQLAAEWGEDPFAPPPADAVCAQVYGGPQTASVSGTWRGREVAAQFARTDSCLISRWDNAVALLVVRAEGGTEGIEPSESASTAKGGDGDQ